MSRNGVLAYLAAPNSYAGAVTELAWIARDGTVEPIGFEGTHDLGLLLSPDERRVAVGRFEGGEAQVWVYDLERGTKDQLTHEGQSTNPSAWSRDGRRIVVTSTVRGNWDLFSVPADGSGAPTAIVDSPNDETQWTWSAKEDFAAYEGYGPESGVDIWVRREGEPGSAARFTSAPGDEKFPRISSDGRWLGYVKNNAVYIERFPQGGGRVKLTDDVAEYHWSASSNEIYYRKETTLYSVPYGEEGGELRLGKPVRLFDEPDLLGWFPARDGSRFLVQRVVPEHRPRPVIRIAMDGPGELR
jgi:dipeptidyl aminopeptidase/acylaminoacyl peptidase